MSNSAYGTLLQKIVCPVCKGHGSLQTQALVQVDAEPHKGHVDCTSCGACFPIQEGILILTPTGEAEASYWDRVYSEGIRGNTVSGVDKTTMFLSRGLEHIPSLCAFFPLIGLLAREGRRFEYSVEIGCGTGSYSLLLKRLGIVRNVVLVDTSASAIRIAQRVFENFKEPAFFIVADGLRLPFVDRSFDLSLSGGLIEHFKGDEQRKIVAEHCRVAGSVVCQVPAPTLSYWLQRTAITWLNGGWPFGYEKPLSGKELTSLFRDGGVEVHSSTYHDFLTVALYRLAIRFKHLRRLIRKTAFNRCVMTEVVLCFVSQDGETRDTRSL